jgi:C1A family cysteine protease
MTRTEKAMSKTTRHFGWKPQRPDIRDLCFSPLHKVANSLPPRVDLRSLCPPVVDQGQLGSCTANAIAAAHEFAQMKQGEKAFAPSRLFIYYNERSMEGTVSVDSGAAIRDGFRSIAKMGVCRETCWPYLIAKFARKPKKACFLSAARHKAVQYLAVTPVLDRLKGCIADGFPFVFGFTVYESFESDAVARSGMVPMPAKSEQVLGGHAVVCVGYDDRTQLFTVRNSWGTGWADGGYCYMPYPYLTDPQLASDFWTCRIVQ